MAEGVGETCGSKHIMLADSSECVKQPGRDRWTNFNDEKGQRVSLEGGGGMRKQDFLRTRLVSAFNPTMEGRRLPKNYPPLGYVHRLFLPLMSLIEDKKPAGLAFNACLKKRGGRFASSKTWTLPLRLKLRAGGKNQRIRSRK